MVPGPTEIIACAVCHMLHARVTLRSGNTFGGRLWSDGKLEASMCPELPAVSRCLGCARIFWVADAARVGEIDAFRDAFPLSTCEVVLTLVGGDRAAVIAAMLHHLPLDLARAMECIERLPCTIMRRSDERMTKPLRADLAEAGARFEIVRHPPPPLSPVVPAAWRQAPALPTLDAEGFRAALSDGLAGTHEREIHLRVRAWWSDNDPARVEGGGWIPFRQRSAAVAENLERLAALLSMDVRESEAPSRLLRAEAARELCRFDEALATLARGVAERDQRVAAAITALAERGEDAVALIQPDSGAMRT
jgi:hypothetical protein